MKALPLLALLLFSSPALAKSRAPGVKLEVLRLHGTRARVRVGNPGRRRAPYRVAAYDPQGRELKGVQVSPNIFSLAGNRSREVRFQNLPSTSTYLCATATVSPSLSLRSCVHKD